VIEEREDERAGLHIDEGANREKADAVLKTIKEFMRRASFPDAAVSLEEAVVAIEAWVDAGDNAAEASVTEGHEADAANTAAVEARSRVQAAGEVLEKHSGLIALASVISGLVVVKVEATGDVSVERKAVTKLVGAEEHRARLEALLKRRKALTGT